MDGYSISQMAERTGFSASTLRFYEQSGLVRPGRTRAGYRSYDDSHIDLLAFIGRAKGFGLSLDEIIDVLALIADERCAPVQGCLRDLVDAKIADAQRRIGELVAFTAELRRVSTTLADHTPNGPCDSSCGCLTDSAAATVAGVALITRPTSADPPIVCTLGPGQVGDRVADWRSTLAQATIREPIEGGTRARFPVGVDVSALAALAAAEQDCCAFLSFALTIDSRGVILDVTGPADARPLIDSLIGTSP